MRFERVLLLTPIFFIGCQATQRIQESTCKMYQTGNFIQNEYNNSGLGHWRKMSFLINRTNSSETIISTKTILPDDTSYYSIKWLTPCSYELTYISSTNMWVDSLIKNRLLPDKQKFFIIKGNEKYYIQRQDDEKDTVWIR
jgi:hypothetical protein